MKDEIFEPKPYVSKNAYVKSMSEYHKLYHKSIENPIEFWSEIAKQFHWETPIDKEKFWSYNFDIKKGPIYIKWLDGASTNICYNLLDRNIRLGLGDKIAFYWYVYRTHHKFVQQSYHIISYRIDYDYTVICFFDSFCMYR